MGNFGPDTGARVSFREVKEESYRALRRAGYTWGVAQVAGRCAGVAQVLFGTGVAAVLNDALRMGVSRRTPRHSREADRIVISARGMSWATIGPLAVAAAVAKSNPVVWVRGPKVGPELAAVILDLKVSLGKPIVWGSKTPQGWTSFQIGIDGDVSSSNVSSVRIGKAPVAASWFVCVGGGDPIAVIVSNLSRHAQILSAQREGVALAQSEWHKLERLARKFLVPE